MISLLAALVMGRLKSAVAAGFVELTLIKSSSSGCIVGMYSSTGSSPAFSSCRSVKYGSTVFEEEHEANSRLSAINSGVYIFMRFGLVSVFVSLY